MKMVKIQKRPFKINPKRPFLYNISYKKILWILQFTYSMLRRLHQLLGYAHLNGTSCSLYQRKYKFMFT